MKVFICKNIDPNGLQLCSIPSELLEGPLRRPREYEDICGRLCPDLFHKIAAIVVRKVLRPYIST
jgi:hypothetical protein